MNEMQKKQLEILKAFIKVCDKHNLRYFLCYGTALGAIRHKGFIPWDDDIDVAMPREDYDKFLKLQYEYEGTPYFIQTYKSDPHYIYNFAKLRDSSTTFIENFFVWYRINHGIWIDIFPIDGMSKKYKNPKRFNFKIGYLWFQNYLLWPTGFLRKFRKKSFFKDLLLNFFGCISYIFNIAHLRNKCIDKWIKSKKMENCELSGCYYGFFFSKEIMPTKIFLEYVKVPFEDIEVNVPKDYDTYLKTIYGDYMSPPPPDKQIGHHHDKGISFTEGYEEYTRKHGL